MATCEMTDVYLGEDGMGVEDWCNETAVGRSEGGLRCCEKHAAGLRKEGFAVEPILQHVWYECRPDCDNEFCPYCRGGLKTCTVCTASEGELLPTCPGVKLTSEQKEACYGGKVKDPAQMRRP